MPVPVCRARARFLLSAINSSGIVLIADRKETEDEDEEEDEDE